MPIVEFRYLSEKISEDLAWNLSEGFEKGVRLAINAACLKRTEKLPNYKVTVEGDPFRIHQKQADLRICVFYHKEWNFTPEELQVLPEVMKVFVDHQLQQVGITGLVVKIRFYARTGYAGATIEP